MHHTPTLSLGLSAAALIDTLGVPALTCGLDLRITASNQRAIDILAGPGDTAIIGQLICDSLDASLVARLGNPVPMTQPQTGKITTPRGLHDCTILALCDNSGQACGYFVQIGAADDPTDGATHLPAPDQHSDQRWRDAIQYANQAIWDHDFEANSHFLSDTWYLLRGMSPGDFAPNDTDDWMATIHADDRDQIAAEWEKIDAGQTDLINYGFRQRHKDGHWVWFLSAGRVVRRDANGRPARIIGTDTDISELKSVEHARRRLSDQLTVAVQAADLQRWEFAIGDRPFEWDDRIFRLYDADGSPQELPLSVLPDIVHPDDQDHLRSYLRERIAHKENVAVDYRMITPEGDVQHMRSRGKYHFDSDLGGQYHGVAFDVTEDIKRRQALEHARAQMEHDSRHDALTGLANRRLLDDVLTQMAQATDPNPQLSVMHIDIDHFKDINDTLGHEMGDATLCHAAEILRQSCPSDAVVARVGGDEFVVLIPGQTNDLGLRALAEKIIAKMAGPFLHGSVECSISTSIGMARTNVDVLASDTVFTQADLALYAAKREGRGRARFFSDDLREEAEQRKSAFDNLARGFEANEIICHYQPQFDSQTLRLTGVEALVRWDSADRGLIMPDAFLGTAREMGLLAQLDDRVLRLSIADMAALEAQGLQVPRLSVNVSAHRLNDPQLIANLPDLDLGSGQIVFELLESAFLDAHSDTVRRNLEQLRDLGIEIEIDDFGSGHASIVSLLETAPDRLKIDRTLVQPIVETVRQRDLVKTIVEIGRMLDVQVIAEGVESVEHVRILRDLGCHVLQGYGLARPMSAAQLSVFLTDLKATGDVLQLG